MLAGGGAGDAWPTNANGLGVNTYPAHARRGGRTVCMGHINSNNSNKLIYPGL